MKKVVIINSSFRKNGNSSMLAKSFYDGAIASGNIVQMIDIKDLNIKFCIGCLSCQNTKKCVLDDGMNQIYDIIEAADIIVIATPIYYYSVSGQLKTFLDRLNPLYSRNNKFKEVYLLASAADTEESAIDGAVKAVEGFVLCFDGVKLVDSLLATDVNLVGDVTKTVFLEEAYRMGLKIK